MFERTRKNRAAARAARAATIAALLALGSGAVLAEEPGSCYKASIPAPIVLPDGSVHPGGELRICMTQRLSPVEWLHVVYIDGGAIGAFRGRDGRVERGIESTQPDIVLLREADGSLRLFGFTSFNAAGARLHRLIPSGTLTAEAAGDGDLKRAGRPGGVTVAAARP